MRFESFSALLAVFNIPLGVSAGPLAAKRQDETTTATLATSASSTAPSVALVVGTNSNGETTTFAAFAPQPTDAEPSVSSTGTADGSVTATPTQDASKTSYTFSPTGQPIPPSTAFPTCVGGKPFCLPNNQSTLYVGQAYYATWDPDAFPINSTVTIKVQFSNDTSQEVWSSGELDNSRGYAAVETNKDWLQGYSAYNLTFIALMFEGDDPTKQTTPYDGPRITLANEPPRHYPPSAPTKFNKEGLLIGLPVSLGCLLVVIVGLFIGMRKHRTIGLGNIMGRRDRGYGVGKSRRQRLGLGKKGAIRLEDRKQQAGHDDRGAPTHSRGDSLGSLVSDDDAIRPAPRTNHFQDEIQRQRTGR